MDSTTLAPALPDLDPALGEQLGDDILTDSAKQERSEKVGTSATGILGGSRQRAPEARAWTAGGNVD